MSDWGWGGKWGGRLWVGLGLRPLVPPPFCAGTSFDLLCHMYVPYLVAVMHGLKKKFHDSMKISKLPLMHSQPTTQVWWEGGKTILTGVIV